MSSKKEQYQHNHIHAKKKLSRTLGRSKLEENLSCESCNSIYCVRCLSKYRMPGESKAPTVCKNCFPTKLFELTYVNRSFEEHRMFIKQYMIENIFHKSVDNNEILLSDNDIERIHETQDGYYATRPQKPKIPVKAKVLDKVAMGMLKMSGMYDGGKFTRKYINKASRRTIKYIEKVDKIEKYVIKVPYRYTTNDYHFDDFGLSPDDILPPLVEDEPETYDLVVKVYYHEDPSTAKTLQPVVMWMHGGGFVMGDVDDSVLNRTMQRFANMINGVVVSVNYRLAPEFKWPTQPEDCYSALYWIYEHGQQLLGIDPNLISIGGDSAGGNLSTVVAIMSKERNGPKIIHHVAVYPGVHGESTESESYKNYGNGPFLRLSLLRWFKKQYLYAPDANCGVHPYLSPLLYKSIVGLPCLSMITGGYCPLTDHAKQYADRFYEARIPVSYSEYSTSFHGFYHSFSLESIQAITQTGILFKLHIEIAKEILYGKSKLPPAPKIHEHEDATDNVDYDEADDNPVLFIS